MALLMFWMVREHSPFERYHFTASVQLLKAAQAATITIGNIGLAFDPSATEPTVLDRLKYFNIHSSPGSVVEWPLDDATRFQSDYSAHLGRSFDVSYAMSQSHPDPARNNMVDIGKLQAWCQGLSKFNTWSESNVDMIISSKVTVISLAMLLRMTPQLLIGRGLLSKHWFWLYSSIPRRVCRFLGAVPPLLPAANASGADVEVHHYIILIVNDQAQTYCEVANECNVHTAEVNTTFEEMIDLHVAIAQAVRREVNTTQRQPG
jgi:hypothetical protein